MKKFILSIYFIYMLVPSFVFAVDTGDTLWWTNYKNTNCQPIGGTCPEGCFKISSMYSCTACLEGTYKDEFSNATSCKGCTLPPATGFNGEVSFLSDKDGTYLGLTADVCPWRGVCLSGQYFDEESFRCSTCPTHYHQKDPLPTEACYITAYRNPDTSAGSGSSGTDPEEKPAQYLLIDTGANCGLLDVCDGNIYTLHFYKDTSSQQPYKDAYVKYSVGFAMDADLKHWNFNGFQGADIKPEMLWWENFTGYYLSDGITKVFDVDGKLSSGASVTTFVGNTNIYCGWEDVYYHVNFYLDNTDITGPEFYTQQCQMGRDCNLNKSDYTDPTPQSGSGIFLYWECCSGDNSCTINRVYTNTSENVVLPAPTESYGLGTPIKLCAVFQKCRAGYYCTVSEQGNLIENPCPMGTTSTEGGADSVEDCYIVSGNTGTRFCDNNGCFYLPDSGIINY